MAIRAYTELKTFFYRIRGEVTPRNPWAIYSVYGDDGFILYKNPQNFRSLEDLSAFVSRPDIQELVRKTPSCDRSKRIHGGEPTDPDEHHLVVRTLFYRPPGESIEEESDVYLYRGCGGWNVGIPVFVGRTTGWMPPDRFVFYFEEIPQMIEKMKRSLSRK